MSENRMTPERLAEIREWIEKQIETMPRYRAGLNPVDAAALIAELDAVTPLHSAAASNEARKPEERP